MKRTIAFLIVLVLMSVPAYAVDVGDLFGGLTEIFGADDSVTYAVGETGTIDGISVTLNSVMEGTGNSTYTPEDGNVYLVCELTVENNSDEELPVSTMMCFSTSCDGEAYALSLEALGTALLSGKIQLDCVIEPGQKMTGVIGYEVLKDWKDLKIRYTPFTESGDRLTFVASH